MLMLNEYADGDLRPKKTPQFQAGQLVRHRRYGYRGVVVEVDTNCRANEAWYQKNMTQPDRNQPWYHVLVHDTETTTYAAEENLEPELDARPVRHPLVEFFFDSFLNGAYIRNNRPWIIM